MPVAAGRAGDPHRERAGRFFVPPYVGPKGWIGARLDGQCDWDQVALVLEDAYRMVAPKKLLAEFDSRSA